MHKAIINFIQLILHSIPDQWSPTRSISLFTPFPTNGRLPVAFHFLLFILHSSLFTLHSSSAYGGERYNFNAGWTLALGDMQNITPATPQLDVTLPYAFNQTEAFSRNCGELSDTVMVYTKHFRLPRQMKGRRVMIEFEGVRFAATVYLNGKEVGTCDNGVMAFGFDLTPYIDYKGENILQVRVDNDWNYHEKSTGSTFQWNNKNFYCNYGGINKNVWLHVMDNVYQTLPLYSNLGTTGVYVYATDIDVRGRSATVNCETQVVNSSGKQQTVEHKVLIIDSEGTVIADFASEQRAVSPNDTVILKTSKRLNGLHFWSWGYGYLYTIRSIISINGRETDRQDVQTGFRKTAFRDGMFFLNDRVLQLKGFAQRSTNEWPAVGISVPSWMSDYSNRLVLECNGNFFRWMHVTPSKQDVRSFDRLGLIQAMPAGDAEKDVTGRRWQQRLELMRDAIIYNRNNPSVIFYEGGNNVISEEHMLEMKALRDKYDPNGGRAMGCRNMLDSKVAEYGGEMLYVNKSAGKPMWQMEYNRDEGIRRYWDEWSYPYHKEGEGPSYRGEPHVVAYNHNQDGLAKENIVRWNEYWMARPGQGRRVNSGGAKIIFSDSNTHARGEKNYRTSGDVDAMRIPKDSYFCHQVMWDGWVDTEWEHTYIIGHWEYDNSSTSEVTKSITQLTKPVYVCSTADEVELFLNGTSLGKGKQSDRFLFTWPEVTYCPGELSAVGYKDGTVVSTAEKHTVGKPVGLRMKVLEPQAGLLAKIPFRADGADLRIIEVEAVGENGERCPLANDKLHFTLTGNGTFLGGISGVVSEEERQFNATQAEVKEGHSKDNNSILSQDLQLEAGVCRVLVRSTTQPGTMTLTVQCPTFNSPLSTVNCQLSTVNCPTQDGFYVDDAGNPVEADWAKDLPPYLQRGETPSAPSFVQEYTAAEIARIDVKANGDKVGCLTDDNEDSKWSSDGRLENACLTVTLSKPEAIRKIALRMDGFRTTSYPLQVIAYSQQPTANSQLSTFNSQLSTIVWQGYTPKNLGDCYLFIDNPVVADKYEIRMIGEATVKEAFASMTELAAKKNLSTKVGKSTTLSIAELEFDK